MNVERWAFQFCFGRLVPRKTYNLSERTAICFTCAGWPGGGDLETPWDKVAEPRDDRILVCDDLFLGDNGVATSQQ
jgi:hypothetical protein